MQAPSRRDTVMYLTATGVCFQEMDVEVKFEKIGESFLLVSVDYDSDSLESVEKSEVPSYWRLVVGRNIPPLEIGINTETKRISRMAFFADRCELSKIETPYVNGYQGEVVVDTDIFKRRYDFVDVIGDYSVTLCNGRLICLFDNYCASLGIVEGEKIGFIIDKRYSLCGFVIKDLSEQEIRLLESLLDKQNS